MFPTDDMALTHILVVADVNRASDFYRDVLGAEFRTPPVNHGGKEIRAFFRDPDGHLFEISLGGGCCWRTCPRQAVDLRFPGS